MIDDIAWSQSVFEVRARTRHENKQQLRKIGVSSSIPRNGRGASREANAERTLSQPAFVSSASADIARTSGVRQAYGGWRIWNCTRTTVRAAFVHDRYCRIDDRIHRPLANYWPPTDVSTR